MPFNFDSSSANVAKHTTTTDPKMAERHIDSRDALLNVTKLEFQRVRTAAGSDRIYGSVAPEDVVSELQRLGVTVDKASVVLENGKLKEIGTHKVVITFGGGVPEMELEVEVKEFGSE